jgi:hypothetical protein
LLKWRQIVQDGGELTDKQSFGFSNLAAATARLVFTEATRPLIVLSTCQNSHQLGEWQLTFDIVIADRLAACTEPEALTPLRLRPKKVIMTGHDSQPKFPFLKSAGKNEYYEWLLVSLFRRMTILYKDQTIEAGQVDGKVEPEESLSRPQFRKQIERAERVAESNEIFSLQELARRGC